MAIDPIYQRITFVDANGKLTREAIRLLEQIGTTGNTVQNISNTTVMQGQASAFDDVPQRDVTREIINALLQTGDTPRTVDTDVAANVDWSSPQAPADPLAGIVLADTPAPIQLDPLAYAILNDTQQPAQIDPLSGLALFETGCWDQAGAAAALLTTANTWSAAQAFTSASLTGKITSYNGVSTIGAGIPSLIKTIDLTAQAAEIGSTVLYAVPASGAGLYRVSMYNVVTRAATTSSTLPAAVANWTDFDSSTGSGVWVSGQSTGNYVGANGAGNSYMFYAKASTNITYNTSGYASVGGTSMQFSLHIRLEYLG